MGFPILRTGMYPNEYVKGYKKNMKNIILILISITFEKEYKKRLFKYYALCVWDWILLQGVLLLVRSLATLLAVA